MTIRDAEYWGAVADKARETLAELVALRDERAAELETLKAKVLQWEQIVANLNPIVSPTLTIPDVLILRGIADLSLADACRAILKKVKKYKTARGIRDVLSASGYNLDQHNNPLASIHGVLKRLVDSGEAEQMTNASGTTYYRATPKLTGADLEASTK